MNKMCLLFKGQVQYLIKSSQVPFHFLPPKCSLGKPPTHTQVMANFLLKVPPPHVLYHLPFKYLLSVRLHLSLWKIICADTGSVEISKWRM
uniref:Uncharacterized protein n=1 Tax=Pyxicephalus adspersus TaxID=30357 RepID=A0AAV3AIF8_PYXAD|nr:TPA: hypothetical protein GDO54_012611 [Pyxicephalus adspersus]